MQEMLDTALKSHHNMYNMKIEKGKSASLGINAMHHHTNVPIFQTPEAFYLLKMPSSRVIATS